MEATKKAPRLTEEDEGKETRLTTEENKGKETLDADVWGKLQEHIPLQAIYKKFSQRDLFHLRLVSKEWNHAALQWILPKPSFVFIAAGIDPTKMHVLIGIVTYNSVYGEVKFNRHRLRWLHVKNHGPPCEVEGLILCQNPGDLEQRGVFNVHTQTWHAIPPGPKHSKSLFACGLLVDTTVKPYTFKLIEGSRRFRTRIYDSKSRSWSRTVSILPPVIAQSLRTKSLWTSSFEYSCICHNDSMYMSARTDMILKYCLKDDKWTSLKSPNLKSPVFDVTLGVWAGQIFNTREYRKKQKLTVWELVDFEGQEWVEYAHMSKEHYKYLLNYNEHPGGSRVKEVFLRLFFRDGYLLVCPWGWDCPLVINLMLFNMATKIWQEVALPWKTMAIDKDEVRKWND